MLGRNARAVASCTALGIMRTVSLPAPRNSCCSPAAAFLAAVHPRSLVKSPDDAPRRAEARGLSGGAAHVQHPNIGKFTERVNFVDKFDAPFETFRVMDEHGRVADAANEPAVTEEVAKRMMTTMLRLNVMDAILYEAQRQGRLSFYMTNYGEEATHVGSAAALEPEDVLFGQYREAGVLLWRGFTFQQVTDQCTGNSASSDGGRMMPVHYGSRALNFHTISSPLATQLPQAAGAAYALKLQGREACVVCYFGDGAASEGDFHAGLNFAATLSCPVVFFCRNNGYAISTPIAEQYKGDGIAVRGVSYNIATIRCDGNDVWAVYSAMKEARRIAVEQRAPVLVEAMTYRGGHHSTSDDASRYRGTDEVNSWTALNNPIARMRLWMEARGWWGADQDAAARADARAEILAALVASEKKPGPPLRTMVEGVYAEAPPQLRAQEAELHAHLQKYRAEYPVLDTLEGGFE